MFKKALVILLALLLIYNSAGFILAYFQIKSYFKSEAREKISNYLGGEELTVLRIQNDELASDKFERVESHEIRYHGKLYDIFSERREGDFVVFICICDENENRLDEVFNVYFDNNVQNEKSKSAASNILRLLIKFALIPDISSNYVCNIHQNFYPLINISLISGFLEIPTPPPKSFS